MPIYEFQCRDCGTVSEILVTRLEESVQCESCGSPNLNKIISAHSSFSGAGGQQIPGPGDTACCGSSPATAGCAGPGSCCGKSFG